MAELEDVLSRLEKVFNSINIKYIIVGGVAIIHYGRLRTTQDIDIIIEDNYQKFPTFLEILKRYDFDVMTEQFYAAYKDKSQVSIFDNKSPLRLDIKIAFKKNEINILSKAIKKNVLGNELNISPLEYVLLGKILFIGNIEDIPDSELLEYQDVLDFITLYHLNKEEIIEVLLNQLVKEVGLNHVLKRLKAIKF